MLRCCLHFDNKLVTHYRVDDKETQVADRLASLPSPQAHETLDFLLGVLQIEFLRDGQALKISGIPCFGSLAAYLFCARHQDPEGLDPELDLFPFNLQ